MSTLNSTCEAELEYKGAHVRVYAATVDDLLASLAKFGAPFGGPFAAGAPAKAEATKPSTKKSETLTAEQQAAVDDTAGLEDANAKKSGAGTARTSPTAQAEEVGAPATTESASGQPAGNAEVERQVSTAATDVVVTYDQVRKKVLELHKINPDATLPVAKAMGFENFKGLYKPNTKPEVEVRPGVFAEAITKLDEAIEAQKVPA